ncbi:MAG: hypothetical protein KME35_12305 [Aphanocapsa sp. GSE-SYN-MK-11-07L]|jgi:hypothetical protein|nr:hypothetical protein [Aphanocapsa sp. GSE-SYN-MK-11-07L]
MTNSLETVTPEAANSTAIVLRISPLIWLAVLGLYLTLMLPLPFLAQVSLTPVPTSGLIAGIGLGGVALYLTLTQQVHLDPQGIRVVYPNWVPKLWQRGWALDWSEIVSLTPRSTGQGGLVYYLVSQTGQAYLLPTRVAGFSRMVSYIQAQTKIDTSVVRPLAQPWMYSTLLVFALLMGLVDAWVIGTAIALG